ncbi:LutB/LldF family L-lactate oxidation iron-sulfur protein [Anaerobiospirillum thomasii]|uniref:Lactate utilization protein B n=2 Tax=Gammaproteobacteria TaxID=1236 RepID=A0A2X0VB79_9GAMM|nr:LutB/LldF family L-lactate oxidation iron-sulfur protein [Anaerobiospirillum thomasii]SPT70406.1 Lactate utilization protein B [Anaerobiospirillum thomasii]
MSESTLSHSEIVHIKVNDAQMRENLKTAMHTLQTNRLNLIENKYHDWQGLRDKARGIKNRALSSLHDRVVEFEKNATRNGIKVHFASSDTDACQIIYQIMMENNVDRILKGKSMASEEIGLNHFLEKKGLVATESDLGELILQLNNEPPVHIVVPAIHRNRYEVGQIFHDKLNAPLESDIEKLNGIARNHLRSQFKTLKMGLSGANFGISKEGAIWLIENEGNGRMCTTAPDIHVAIMGIEKIVETFDDAATLVHLLTPSATGQFIPTYNNIITSPRKNGDKDGPKQVHIVIFDHNRSSMLTHDDFYEALRCIRCGACMNFCPVYDKIGGHSYRTTYPGPIGEVISPNLFGIDKTGDVLSFCSQCGRCSEVCPVKIPLANLIRRLRSYKVGQGAQHITGQENIKISKGQNFSFKIYKKIATNGSLWRSSLSKAYTFKFIVDNFGESLPVLKNWAQYKKLPSINGVFDKRVQEIEGVSYE